MASNVVHNLSVPTTVESDIAVYQVTPKAGRLNFLLFNNGEKIAQAGQGGMKAGSEMNLKVWESDDRQAWTPIASAITTAFTGADELFTVAAHGLVDGDKVQISSAAPTGYAVDTDYYVVSAASGTFQLSATKGGAAIDGTSDTAAVVVGSFTTVSPGGTQDFSVIARKPYLKVTGRGTVGGGYVRVDIQHRGDPYFGQVDIDLIAKSGYAHDSVAPDSTNGVGVFGGDVWPETY